MTFELIKGNGSQDDDSIHPLTNEEYMAKVQESLATGGIPGRTAGQKARFDQDILNAAKNMLRTDTPRARWEAGLPEEPAQATAPAKSHLSVVPPLPEQTQVSLPPETPNQQG